MDMNQLIFIMLPVFLLLFNGPIEAQRMPSLDRFEIFRINDFVKIDLILSQGAFCDGIKYYRSSDGINYQFIGQVSGICGSNEQAERYEFTDAAPLWNTCNHYKVEFGGYGFSEVVKIEFIELEKNGSTAVPNPATDKVRVFFENFNQKPFNLQLINLNGQTLITTQSYTDQFTIDLSSIPAGFYLYEINSLQDKLPRIQGKLLVK